jgi:hypothetical protein
MLHARFRGDAGDCRGEDAKTPEVEMAERREEKTHEIAHVETQEIADVKT